MRYILYSQFILSLWRVSEAIQCFSCISNDKTGKFCRKVSEAQIVTCPNDSTFCNALVFLKNGAVNVDRGCGGSVSSWGFGRTECDIMTNDALMDVGVAFYQCRGDVCNNIEPADDTQPTPKDSGVVLLTKTVEQADSGNGLASNAAKSVPSSYPGDEDDNAGYGPPKPKVTRPPPPPPPPPTAPRAYPTTESEDVDDTEATVPYAPVKTSRPPPPPPPPVRTKPAPAYPQEDTTEAPPPYVPVKPPPPPPAPVRARPPPPAYPVDTTEAPPPYVPVKPQPPPYVPPKPTPAPYVPTPKDNGYGNEEEEDTEPPITYAPVKTRPAYQEIKQVETEEPYAPRPTTTTTPRRRTRPDYGAEVINTEETVVTFRPTRPHRTVFDRKRRQVD